MNFQNYINGHWVDALDGNTWDVRNPATGEIVQTVPFGGADDASTAIDAAHSAQAAWAARTAYERAEILNRVATLVRARIDALAPLMTQECGKAVQESRGEWRMVGDIFEWYAEEGKRIYGRAIPSRHAHKRLLSTFAPVGVITTITAWNFPAYLPGRKWAAALAAGCTIVARPSELTPLSAMALVNIMEEAGMPPGVINLVNGDAPAIGEAFLQSPKVRKLSFTGSQRVGSILMRQAAESFKRLSLELGGSAPVLVFPDVDVAQTAAASVTAKFRNNGQVCISPTRFYVHRDIAEEYIEAVRTEIEKLKIGDGLDETVNVGPLITMQARARVEGLVADAVATGALVITGGAPPAAINHGAFFAPTLLLNTTEQMKVMREEVFGPIMLIQQFDTMEEVLEKANGTPYGLAAYVFARDITTITRAYEGLDFGVIGVNDLTPATAEAPFGGMKESGFGRENGSEGLLEYLEVKFVAIALT